MFTIRLVPTFFLCAVLGACNPAKQQLTASSSVESDLKRTLLFVEDADRALKLYRDILGFKVVLDTVRQSSGVDLPAGDANATQRVLLLKGNDDVMGHIALLQWLDPPLKPRAQVPIRLGIGDVALVFGSTKIDEHCNAIAKLEGIRFTAEIRTQVIPRGNGKPDTQIRGCNFFDADGYFLEIEQNITPPSATR